MSKVLILNQYPVNDPKAEELLAVTLGKIVVDENGKPFENWKIYNIVDSPIHDDDTKTITEPQFKKAFNMGELKDVIQYHEPTTIIALGSKACKLLTGEKTLKNGIKKEHELLPEFEYQCEVYVNYAPKYIIDNTAFRTDFMELFDRAFNGIKVKTTPFSIIETIDQLAEVLQDCIDAGIIVFDFETNGLDYWSDETKPTCLSITYQAGYSHVLPLYHEESHWEEKDFKTIWKLIKLVMEDPKVIKVNHNIKFDLHFILRFCTKKIRGRVVDTMLQHHLLDENSKHGLKDITAVIYPHCDGYEIKPDDWGKVPFKTLLPYAATDTDNTFKFFVHFENELIEDDDDHKLYVILRNETMPSMMTMLRAEHRGAYIDRGYIEESIKFAEGVLKKLSDELMSFKEVKRFEKSQREYKEEKLIAEIEEKMKTSKAAQYKKYEDKIVAIRSGELQIYEGINLASTQQLGDLLFEREGFGLPLFKEKYSKKLIKTTDKNALATYLPHPFIEALVRHRSVAKMISTYYRGILDKLDKNDYLHSSFLLHGTTTGRLSCLAAGSMIETLEGAIPIETLCPDDYGVQDVKGVYVLTHKNRYRAVTKGINKGLEMMYEVELESGQKIKCTAQHKFLTNKGWLTLEIILTLQNDINNNLQIVSYGDESNGLSNSSS